jgi:hypothetical protein
MDPMGSISGPSVLSGIISSSRLLFGGFFCVFCFPDANHGAGIWIPTYAQDKSPSHVGKYTRHGAYGFGGIIDHQEFSRPNIPKIPQLFENIPNIPEIPKIIRDTNWILADWTVWRFCEVIWDMISRDFAAKHLDNVKLGKQLPTEMTVTYRNETWLNQI